MSRHNKGLTLIEIIVAMLILSFGIAASLKLFAVLDERMVTSSYFYTATNLARDVIEFGESVDFSKPFKMLYKHAPGEGYGVKEWKDFDPAGSIHPFALMGEIQEKELVPTETPESVEISYEVKEDSNFYDAYRQDINVSWNVKDGEQDEIKVAAIPITTNNQLKLEIQDFWWEKGKDLPVVPPPPPNEEPVANISANPTSGNADLTVEFNGSGSEDSDGNIVSHKWNFGDGSPTKTGIIVFHTYTSKGTYTASLTVTDDEGATNTKPVVITVTKAPTPLEPPVAVIKTDRTSGESPLTVAFDGSGSYDPDGPDESITYFWDFGHDRTSTNVQDTRSFTFTSGGGGLSVGIYSVTLKVTDKDGKTNTASVDIKVYAAAPPASELPIAVISASPTSGPTPLTVDFDGSESSPSGSITYFWDFGQDGTSTNVQDTRIFSCGTSQANYPVSLTVTDNDGEEGKATVTITVSPASGESLEAVISANPTSGEEPLTVAFDGSGSSPSGSITYFWDFDDGESATGSTTSHAYTSNGTYTASLTVTDNNGETDSESVDIEVIESGPIEIEFDINPAIWVNDKYPHGTTIKRINVPKTGTYELSIQAEYTGEEQIGEEYCLQVNNGITGPIVPDQYNGPNDPTLKWISHGSYSLNEGENIITFHKGGQPNRDPDGDHGPWTEYSESDPKSWWTWYLGGSVHFKKIKIKTVE